MRSVRAILSCAFVLPAALISLVFAPTAAAQDVEVYVSADTVTVGERFRVSISAAHDFASPPEFPNPAAEDSIAFGDVEVIRRVAGESLTRGGSRIDSVVYEVATFALDTARIAPIPIVFSAGEDTFTVHTEGTWVPVASLVPSDAEDVRDLAPLVEFPVSIWRYVLAAAAILLLAALIAFLLWRRRKKRQESIPAVRKEPPDPPDVEAFRRLSALENMDVSRREAIKPFYVELSDTLRTYVSRRLGVQALERTTNELIFELENRGIPDDETTGRLRNILSRSDYVKFADAEPPVEESRTILGTAKNVVESVERQTRPKATSGLADEDMPTVDETS